MQLLVAARSCLDRTSQSQILALHVIRTDVRVSCRPTAFLSYEHMFSLAPTSKLAQRALGALRLARSFLLLEDDYDVDWEVGQDERATRTASASSAAARSGAPRAVPASCRHGRRRACRPSGAARRGMGGHVCAARSRAGRARATLAREAHRGRLSISWTARGRPRRRSICRTLVPDGHGTTTGRPRRPVYRKNRRRPTLPGPCEPSTIGAEGLNCSVRNGKRCFPLAKATGKRRETTPPTVPQNCTAPHRVSLKNPSSPRPISTGLLQTLPSFQIRPINLVVYQGSYSL